MSRLIRLMPAFLIVLGLFAVLATPLCAEQVDEEALKRHVYNLNKPNLKSKSWLERAGACERIGALGFKEYTKDIEPLLRDPNFLVRLSAVRGVGMCGDPQYVEAIVDILTSLGDKHKDRLLAVNCGWAIGQMDPSAGADSVLNKYASKKTAEAAVALALGYIGGDKASAGLAQFLTSKDEKVLQNAIRSAGRLSTPLDTKNFNKMISDKKTPEAIRLEIIHTYRKRKTEEAKPALEKLLAERSSSISYASAWALAEIGLDSKEVAKIATAAEKGSIEEKLAALKCFVLGGAKENPEAALELVKVKTNDNVRMGACNVFINFPNPKAKMELMKTFNSDRSKFVRYFAGIALGSLKDEDVSKDLANTVKNNKDVSVVARASEAISVAKHSSVADTLVDAIKASDNDVYTLLVAMGLAEAAKVDGSARLLGLLNDNDNRVRCNAAIALRYFPTANVVNALIGQFNRDFPKAKPADIDKFKTAVNESLERMTGHKYKPDATNWMEWWKHYQEIQKGKDLAKITKQHSANEQRKDHTEAIKFFGGSSESEEGVEMGLLWLATHQEAAGHWDSTGFNKHDEGKKSDGPALDQYDVAMVGLALLCYTSAGYTHMNGKYQDVCERALEWLMTLQLPSGAWRDERMLAQPDSICYEQATALIAVTESYAMTRDFETNEAHDKAMKFACQMGVDWIQSYQNILLGWRYTNMAESNDSSVTGWYVLAVKAARANGFRVFEKCFDGALRWLDSVSQKTSEYEIPDLSVKYEEYFKQKIYDKCGTGYDDPQVLPSMTAIALLTRRFIGLKRTHPLIRANANYLMDFPPGDKDKHFGARNFNVTFYYLYYATLANFQMGAEYWDKWKKELITVVRDMQVKDESSSAYGSWYEARPFGALRGGRIYCTTLMILTLEVYYRYNPLLEENIIVID